MAIFTALCRETCTHVYHFTADDAFNPLTADHHGHDYIRVFSILDYHFKYQILGMLKINRDSTQQNIHDIVDLHVIKSV